MRRGDVHAEEGSHAEAILEYKNALEIDSRHAAAHYGLAKSYLARQDLDSAYVALRETITFDPQNLEAKLTYALISILAGEAQEAFRQAEEVITVDPKFPRAYLVKAQALRALERPEEMQASLERALEDAVGAPSALLLLARFHLSRGDAETAESELRRLIEIEPSYRAYASLGGLLAQQDGREEQSEAAYREALVRAEPDERSLALRVLSSFYLTSEQFDKAIDTLEEGIEEAPDDAELFYALANIYRSTHEPARAEAVLERAIQARPGDVWPRILLSADRARSGDLPGALEVAQEALEVDPENSLARLRNAELLIELGRREGREDRIAEGKRIVDGVLEREPSLAEALFVKSQIELSEGRVKEAVKRLRTVITLRPDLARAHANLGRALLRQGSPHEARAAFGSALEIDAGLVDTRKDLARLHASLGDHELALREAQRVLRQEPRDRGTRLLIAESLVHLRKPDDALAVLEAAPDAEGDFELLYAIARLYRLKGQFVESRNHLLRADALRPRHPEILRAFLDLDKREGRLGESLERIEGAAAAEPSNAELVRLEGLALLSAGRASDAEARFRRAIEIAPEDLDAYRTLARYLASVGRSAEILGIFEKALAKRPDSAELHYSVGSLYKSAGARDRAIDHYEEAIRLDPELAPPKNDLAYLLAEAGTDLDRALELAREAFALRPETPQMADTLGWVLYRKGMASAAIFYLQEAERTTSPEDPNLGLVRYHLALAHEANDEPGQALEVLERGLADQPAATEADAGERSAKPAAPPWSSEARAMLERLKRSRDDPAG